MDAKHTNILQYLMDAYPQRVTAQALSAHLSVSSRSIKNYIKELNERHTGIIHSSRSGYIVDVQTASEATGSEREAIPQTSQQRVSYILKELLQKTRIEKLDLCENLYISLSTLQSLFGQIKRELNKFDLRLLADKGCLYIRGSEQNKRKLYSNVLYDECQSNFMNAAATEKAFPDIDIGRVKEIVSEGLESFRLFANSYMLANLVLHISIAISRIRSGNPSGVEAELPERIDPVKKAAAERIASEIEEHFHLRYSDGEVLELLLLLIYRVNYAGDSAPTAQNVHTYISTETVELVEDIIRQLQEFYGIDMRGDCFFSRFALHINGLLLRSRNYYYSRNPLTDDIKLTSPLIYETAVFVSSVIRQRTGLLINDDEIAYIAMHMGNVVCAQRAIKEKITAVLYCPDYYDINAQLAQRIEEEFSSEIVLENIYTDERQLSRAKPCDLIITTAPIERPGSAAYVLINVFFQGNSAAKLRQSIQHIQQKNKRLQFEGHLRHIIIPDFFEVNRDVKNSRDVIHHMVGQMVALDYVIPSFEEEIHERESISSTAFHGFAIAHSLKMNAKKTGMNILINPEGIAWADKQVHLVLMLCFKPDERHIFHEIFESLTLILTDANCYARIIQCESYEGFIQLVTSMAG